MTGRNMASRTLLSAAWREIEFRGGYANATTWAFNKKPSPKSRVAVSSAAIQKLLVSVADRCCSVRAQFETRGAMTASEYVFAATVTILIVWIVAEVGNNALRR